MRSTVRWGVVVGVLALATGVQRAWLEVEPVEAKPSTGNSVEYRCVGWRASGSAGRLHVHNSGTTPATAEVDWYDAAGAKLGGTDTLNVAGGLADGSTIGATATSTRTPPNLGIVARVVVQSGEVVVDGEMVYSGGGDGQDHRTVTCALRQKSKK